jgi:Ca-activated chloride channel family protein
VASIIYASSNLKQISLAIQQLDSLKPEDVALNEEKPNAKNKQNDSPEDLSGGGQEATKKDMEKERKEETTETEQRKGKELDELPDDFKSGSGELPKNILMRKVDDDPALFLTKKFKYQIKKRIVEVKNSTSKW